MDIELSDEKVKCDTCAGLVISLYTRIRILKNKSRSSSKDTIYKWQILLVILHRHQPKLGWHKMEPYSHIENLLLWLLVLNTF